MTTVPVVTFDEWRARVRQLLAQHIAPDSVIWVDASAAQGALPLDVPAEATADTARPEARVSSRASIRVPRAFVAIAELSACHRDPDKWRVMYRVLWRLQHETRGLLSHVTDPDVHALELWAAQVRRDEHKMHAFVRFTPVPDAAGVRYVAWYQPDHLIVERAAPFFADRFSSMRWSILTPDRSAHWDGETLTFAAGVPTPPADGDDDAMETLWRTYYGAMFNPARVNLAATLREMPVRRWSQLPEAALIPGLVATAHERASGLERMRRDTTARPFVPADGDLDALRKASASCRGCDLHAHATQSVFGEGPADSPLMLVGEQPGDMEDRAGRPFVGPAGEVLDRALAAAGIDRAASYLTNAVKHFAFEERGKRRIHRTPRLSEMHACRPWLEAELHRLRPRCVVCLGSTAARALLGPQARVMTTRGKVIPGTAWAPALIVTVHPSAVLRADDGSAYFEMLVSDLSLARETLAAGQR